MSTVIAPRKRARLTSAAGIMLLVVAACSNGDGSSGTAPGTAPPTAAPGSAAARHAAAPQLPASGAVDGTIPGTTSATQAPGATDPTTRPTGTTSTASRLSSTTTRPVTTTTALSDKAASTGDPQGIPAKGGGTCRTTHPTSGTNSYEQCCADSRARHCDAYDADSSRVVWPFDADGYVTIEYWTNAALCTFSQAEMERNAREAAATWNAAHPKLRFVYKGPSSKTPVVLQYDNVVGCGDCSPGIACAGVQGGSKPRFFMILNSRIIWDTSTCNPAAGTPCTDSTGAGTHYLHLQSTLTHEDGHLVCYASDLYHPSTSRLTLHGMTEAGQRHHSTLGLGDLLTVRSCYGWAPLPYIYDD